jgi:hypothetical protein
MKNLQLQGKVTKVKKNYHCEKKVTIVNSCVCMKKLQLQGKVTKVNKNYHCEKKYTTVRTNSFRIKPKNLLLNDEIAFLNGATTFNR